MKRLRLQRERGASTLLVGILLMALVIGGGAIAVDIGTLWMDRKSLQNAADAAALAIASECSKGPSACNTSDLNRAARKAALYVGGTYSGQIPLAPSTDNASCPDNGTTGGICVYFPGSQTVWVMVWDYVLPAFPFIPMFGFGKGSDKLKVGASATAKWALPSLPVIETQAWIPFSGGPAPEGSTIAQTTFTVCPDGTLSSTKWPTSTANKLPGGGWCLNRYDSNTSGNFLGLDTTYVNCWGAQPELYSTNPDKYVLPVTTGFPSKCDFRSLIAPGNVIYIPYFDPADPCVPDQCSGNKSLYYISRYAQWVMVGYCLNFQTVGVQGMGFESDLTTPITETRCDTNGPKSLPLRMVMTYKGSLLPSDLTVLDGAPIRLIS